METEKREKVRLYLASGECLDVTEVVPGIEWAHDADLSKDFRRTGEIEDGFAVFREDKPATK